MTESKWVRDGGETGEAGGDPIIQGLVDRVKDSCLVHGLANIFCKRPDKLLRSYSAPVRHRGSCGLSSRA